MPIFPDPRCARFAMDGERSVMRGEHLGIVNGHATAGTPHEDVFALDTLHAPPYAAAGLRFGLRLLGEPVKTARCTWHPHAIEREGHVRGVAARSVTALAAGMRSLLQRVELRNESGAALDVPVQAFFSGGASHVPEWGFSCPTAEQSGELEAEPHRLLRRNGDTVLALGCSLDMRHLPYAALGGAPALWEGRVRLAPGETAAFSFTLSLGPRGQADRESAALLAGPEAALERAHHAFSARVTDLYRRLPDFGCDNPRLTAFYHRSLLHYLMNEWDVGEFCLRPCYTTGSVRGGCLAGYLWDYAAGWELHALHHPQAMREHICRYLAIDMARHYAFNPVDGRALGPWYPVNQEKLVGLIYYYVRNTGDRAFLRRAVNGKTVAQWAVFHATLGDAGGEPVALMDYGAQGEHHLELRRGFPYRGVMPDLNGRRYLSYLRAHELTCWAGEPDASLLRRAQQVKKLFREALWDGEKQWPAFLSEGRREFRYTVQVFKLLGSPVLDEDQERGLLSHWNEEEFLGAFGLHSLSKRDEAYDQVDIDNGGGGACSIFPVAIAQRLYQIDRVQQADGLLARVLWWGERLPYWGDSMTANYMDYRRDTPLQCTIGGVAGAQCLLFGLLGIAGDGEGGIRAQPRKTALARRITLTGLRMYGKSVDIEVDTAGLRGGSSRPANAAGRTTSGP